jgi:hypothetical protein
MEHTTARILQQSSDAIVIIRLADEALLGINEAFFAVTGHPHHELAGRHAGELFASLETATGQGPDGAASWADSTIGLWTRSGELRCGRLSALVIDVDGQRHAVCTIREVRDPTPAERRMAGRERVARLLDRGGSPLEVTRRAIQALAESLRWEFGALWLEAPASRTLRCAAVWRSPLADLAPLEAASWRAQPGLGTDLVGRSWRDGQAVWASDATAEPDQDRLGQAGDLVHGWFGFPVRAGGHIIGVVEFFSCEVRQPDEELLQLTEQLGGLFGALFEDGAGWSEPPEGAAAGDTPARASVATVLREVEETVETMGETSGGRPRAATAPSVAPPPSIPTGLTLKAVSRRTGIPAATLRTWERRYQFLRPERSTSGYRLYGEREIDRILQVKSLLEQGVRIGAAMETVRREPTRRRAIG